MDPIKPRGFDSGAVPAACRDLKCVILKRVFNIQVGVFIIVKLTQFGSSSMTPSEVGRPQFVTKSHQRFM